MTSIGASRKAWSGSRAARAPGASALNPDRARRRGSRRPSPPAMRPAPAKTAPKAKTAPTSASSVEAEHGAERPIEQVAHHHFDQRSDREIVRPAEQRGSDVEADRQHENECRAGRKPGQRERQHDMQESSRRARRRASAPRAAGRVEPRDTAQIGSTMNGSSTCTMPICTPMLLKSSATGARSPGREQPFVHDAPRPSRITQARLRARTLVQNGIITAVASSAAGAARRRHQIGERVAEQQTQRSS